jgi:hypothetical protein
VSLELYLKTEVSRPSRPSLRVVMDSRAFFQADRQRNVANRNDSNSGQDRFEHQARSGVSETIAEQVDLEEEISKRIKLHQNED